MAAATCRICWEPAKRGRPLIRFCNCVYRQHRGCLNIWIDGRLQAGTARPFQCEVCRSDYQGLSQRYAWTRAMNDAIAVAVAHAPAPPPPPPYRLFDLAIGFFALMCMAYCICLAARDLWSASVGVPLTMCGIAVVLACREYFG
jgi:hypothetical protein